MSVALPRRERYLQNRSLPDLVKPSFIGAFSTAPRAPHHLLEKRFRSSVSTMLITMQVTTGKEKLQFFPRK